MRILIILSFFIALKSFASEINKEEVIVYDDDDDVIVHDDNYLLNVKNKINNNNINKEYFIELEDTMFYLEENDNLNKKEKEILNFIKIFIDNNKEKFKKENENKYIIKDIFKKGNSFLFINFEDLIELKEHKIKNNNLEIIIRPYTINSKNKKTIKSIIEKENSIKIDYNDGYIEIKNVRSNDYVSEELFYFIENYLFLYNII